MDKMYDVPKKKPSKKESKFPSTRGWGAANPNYVEDMVARGRAARKARENARQGTYVNPTYGPIAGSAE
jgi:hypothetical protein